MGTNCAPLVADLFLFCYEADFMLSISDNNQADVAEAFSYTSRYLNDLLNIDNLYFEETVSQIYHTDLPLNKANSSDSEDNKNTFLTSMLLNQGYQYHKLLMIFSKFDYRHSELIVKCSICLKTLLQQGISEPVFYGN